MRAGRAKPQSYPSPVLAVPRQTLPTVWLSQATGAEALLLADLISAQTFNNNLQESLCAPKCSNMGENIQPKDLIEKCFLSLRVVIFYNNIISITQNFKTTLKATHLINFNFIPSVLENDQVH